MTWMFALVDSVTCFVTVPSAGEAKLGLGDRVLGMKKKGVSGVEGPPKRAPRVSSTTLQDGENIYKAFHGEAYKIFTKCAPTTCASTKWRCRAWCVVLQNREEPQGDREAAASVDDAAARQRGPVLLQLKEKARIVCRRAVCEA